MKLLKYLTIILLCNGIFADNLVVVTTIKPIHSLLAGVMEGVAQPELIIEDYQSPHDLQLKPSQVTMLYNSDVIFYIDNHFETAIAKLLTNLGSDTQVFPLVNSPAHITLLPTRKGGIWEDHSHQHDADYSINDFHIWLSADNAKAITQYMADVLSKIDNQHTEQYQQNAVNVIKRIDELNTQLSKQLVTIQHKPFMVFHDAYQYYEYSYPLDNQGAITLEPEQTPSAKRISALRERIKKNRVLCVFSEPQFDSKIINITIENTEAKSSQLDPLGTKLKPGTDAYFQLMQQLADNLLDCLNN